MRATLRISGNLGKLAVQLACRRKVDLRPRTSMSRRLPKRNSSISWRHAPPQSQNFRGPSEKAYRSCPNCNSANLQTARPKRWSESLKTILGFADLFCRECRHQFSAYSWRWDVAWYARCPQCASLMLDDWHEKYYLPPIHKRALILVGANPQRCESCLYNFVSFRPRWHQGEDLTSPAQR